MSKSVIQFARGLKELRIHLCQTSDASKGVRDFITNNYVQIKKANSNTPILIRECSGVQPKLWARYERGREASLPLTNMNESQVMNALEQLNK
jgi:NADH dehydrogenase (ubiquinone) 1 alpha subcomplex subunit 2